MSKKLMPHEKAGWAIQVFGIMSVITLVTFAVIIAPLQSTDPFTLDLRVGLIAVAILPLFIIYLGAAVKRHKARAVGIAFGALLLIVFPVGTVIGAYIVWNLARKWEEGVAVETHREASSKRMLRRIFGPGQAELWQQFASEMGARFVEAGFWGGPKVIMKVRNWTVTLDSAAGEDGDHTRIRAPYLNPDDFRFTISRAHLLSKLSRKIGMEHVESGHAEFDRNFVSKSNHPEKFRRLLDYAPLRALIQAQPSLYLEVKDDEGLIEGWSVPAFPADVDELYFEIGVVVKDLERLKTLFELFSLTLQQLCQMGSAREEDPQITLVEIKP